MRGKFIVVYGMNNLGKSTLLAGLVEHLREQKVHASYLKYPIYDLPSGRRINAYLREGNPENLTAIQAQGIFAQNRRDYEPQLIDRLQSGEWIIAEDYTGTGIAWGMTYGVPLETLEEMNKGLLEPDLAILLDGERFTAGIEKNHKHEESDLWDVGRKVHLQMAERLGWYLVNANQEREEVLGDTIRIIEGKFNVSRERER